MTVGERLVEAFKYAHNTEDKSFIAEELGYSSVQAVYKLINGERELSFEGLVKFQNSTKCRIDWLLTGEGEMSLEATPLEPEPMSIAELLEAAMRRVAREEIEKHEGDKPKLVRIPVDRDRVPRVTRPPADMLIKHDDEILVGKKK